MCIYIYIHTYIYIYIYIYTHTHIASKVDSSAVAKNIYTDTVAEITALWEKHA